MAPIGDKPLTPAELGIGAAGTPGEEASSVTVSKDWAHAGVGAANRTLTGQSWEAYVKARWNFIPGVPYWLTGVNIGGGQDYGMTSNFSIFNNLEKDIQFGDQDAKDGLKLKPNLNRAYFFTELASGVAAGPLRLEGNLGYRYVDYAGSPFGTISSDSLASFQSGTTGQAFGLGASLPMSAHEFTWGYTGKFYFSFLSQGNRDWFDGIAPLAIVVSQNFTISSNTTVMTPDDYQYELPADETIHTGAAYGDGISSRTGVLVGAEYNFLTPQSKRPTLAFLEDLFDGSKRRTAKAETERLQREQQQNTAAIAELNKHIEQRLHGFRAIEIDGDKLVEIIQVKEADKYILKAKLKSGATADLKWVNDASVMIPAINTGLSEDAKGTDFAGKEVTKDNLAKLKESLEQASRARDHLDQVARNDNSQNASQFSSALFASLHEKVRDNRPASDKVIAELQAYENGTRDSGEDDFDQAQAVIAALRASCSITPELDADEIKILFYQSMDALKNQIKGTGSDDKAEYATLRNALRLRMAHTSLDSSVLTKDVFASGGSQPNTTGTLKITVKDQSGAPIPNAAIMAVDPSIPESTAGRSFPGTGITDAAGKRSFQLPEQKTVEIIVNTTAGTTRKQVTLPDTASETPMNLDIVVNLGSSSPAATPSVLIVDEGGLPIPGVRLVITKGSTRIISTTDAEGDTDLQNISNGDALRIIATKPGFQRLIQEVTFDSANPQIKLTMKLTASPSSSSQTPAKGKAELTLTAQGGGALEGNVSVTFGNSSMTTTPASPNASGVVTSPDLKPGTYKMTVTSDKYKTYERSIYVVEGGTVSLSAELEPKQTGSSRTTDQAQQVAGLKRSLGTSLQKYNSATTQDKKKEAIQSMIDTVAAANGIHTLERPVLVEVGNWLDGIASANGETSTGLLSNIAADMKSGRLPQMPISVIGSTGSQGSSGNVNIGNVPTGGPRQVDMSRVAGMTFSDTPEGNARKALYDPANQQEFMNAVIAKIGHPERGEVRKVKISITFTVTDDRIVVQAGPNLGGSDAHVIENKELLGPEIEAFLNKAMSTIPDDFRGQMRLTVTVQT